MARLPRPTPPRGLIFLASAWLMTSWSLTIGIRPPVQMHAASYTPGVRLLLLSIAIGLGVAWPVVRLSGALRAWPIRQTLLDLLVLLCLVQVVIWPLRLVTTWPPARSAAIDVCLVGWSLAIAAITSVGSIPVRSGIGLLRTAAMTAIIAVVAAMPLLTLMGGDSLPLTGRPPDPVASEWWLRASLNPLTAIDALSSGGPIQPTPTEWTLASRGWWVAAFLWALAAVTHPLLPRVDSGFTPRLPPRADPATPPATPPTTPEQSPPS